ncbi:tripartite tricarboxylate transporter TctB family protein [Pseudomonas sp. CNPSo 3701]|uniref:tripartite tricarboxylate transporter TctB family protein n=1 Tax=Pseudomonas sp. CNPSo 3701 TaxID=3027943 RepID=UPI002363EE6F|nr:tripartite tricarboxylate transporter TctB family protein [Pseudomonas sp. CNPSo 3701]MDD1510493.1 tripartite tricarboxylate transporter TctB family protein [Pseudomonas sp. CNPSo 3701]
MSTSKKVPVGERSFCILLVIFSLFVLYQAYLIAGFSSVSSPGAFPLGVGTVLLISALRVLWELRGRPTAGQGWAAAAKAFSQAHFPLHIVVFTLLSVAYLAAIQWASFYISTFVFLMLAIVYLRRGKVLSALLASGISLVAIYLLFTMAFSVYLP